MRKDSCIAIVGGGLSGLAIGIFLKQNGMNNIVVYERDSSFEHRRQGYGLTILQGSTALKRLGKDVFEKVKEMDTPSRSHYIFNSKGDVIGFFGTVFYPAETNSPILKDSKKYNLHIGRQELRRILMEKLIELGVPIQWNKKLSSIEMKDYCMELTFEEDLNEKIKADLVIGCDGINSRVRMFKYPSRSSSDSSQEKCAKEDTKANYDAPLNYLGIIVVLGITGSEHPLTKEKIFQTVDGTTRLYMMPFSNTNPSQNIMWQLSFPLREEEAKELSGRNKTQQLKEYVAEMCRDWHEPVPSMINSTEHSLLMGIPAYDRDLFYSENNEEKDNIVKSNLSSLITINSPSQPKPVYLSKRKLKKLNGSNNGILVMENSANNSESSSDSKENSSTEEKMNNNKNLSLADRIVLIGDACHPMSPFKGQGANQALLDAVSLGEQLIKHDDIQIAIKKFEKEMMSRVESKVLQSRERVKSFHESSILDTESFSYRGVNRELLDRMKENNINSQSGEQLEDLIKSEIEKVINSRD
eukprot:TRINITY_DN7269_c0_g1_i1.p1 TRINITY_DN7269_c0_g1~~TRINITY_DN7269_c0_g1_i1.p1  ORF type:complete len:527 (-),score=185.60 TRINITY_DN7269_c0_g1_i1:398-1978(-)